MYMHVQNTTYFLNINYKNSHCIIYNSTEKWNKLANSYCERQYLLSLMDALFTPEASCFYHTARSTKPSLPSDKLKLIEGTCTKVKVSMDRGPKARG